MTGDRPGDHAAPALDADTRLGALLDRWPEAEAVLRALSPRLRALDDAVVRRAFTRAATLRQVAAAAGVPLAALLERLQGAGLPVERAPATAAAQPRGARPGWADEARVTARRDARADIAAGVHPLPLVVKDLEALAPGGVYALVTPLLPAPLVDLARRKGFETWSAPATGDGPVLTYFRRAVG